MTTFSLPRINDEDVHSSANQGFGALQTEAGNLPLRQLGYRTQIRGLATRTTILQTFYNPFDQPIEATYIFPIEGEQAVVDCEMRVADRIIRAQLKEREQARQDYQRAIAKGHRAALLEENRPETFSMKFGNIAPGEVVQTCIQTVGSLPVAHGEWTLRLPLVVAPRYTSGFAIDRPSAGTGVGADTNQVPDASTVTPPTWLPGFASPVDLRLEVDIEMGSLVSGSDWTRKLRSSLQSVIAEAHADKPEIANAYRVSVHPGERVNRDFILRGDLDCEHIVSSLVVAQADSLQSAQSDTDSEEGKEAAFAIHIVPPPSETKNPRDIVFLLDRSGSMQGWKMEAARRGVCRLIDSLSPEDRFQVLAFDYQLETPDFSNENTPGWVSATDANRFKAVQWLANIEARGGTEMGLAIQEALEEFRETTGETFRSHSVVLVTDGQITGEDSVLRLLGTFDDAARPRMFCLGIDRAVNGSVLKRLAKLSSGTCELVESEKRLDAVMHRFADEIGSPAVLGLKIEAEGSTEGGLQTAPARLPDLYHGRSTSIYGRYPGNLSSLKLTGNLPNGEPWQQEISSRVQETPSSGTVFPLWAKTRIRELEDTFVLGGNRDQGLRDEIVSCSLAGRVLSRFTAYVAVDESERVGDGRAPHRLSQPAELPEGWLPAVTPLGSSSLIPMAGSPDRMRRRSTKTSGTSASDAEFAKIILKMGVSEEQLKDAENLAKQRHCALPEAIELFGYASPEETARAIAGAFVLPYVDLEHVCIEDETIQLVPESIARENGILPYSQSGGELFVLMHDPSDAEVIEKLRFILNRPVRPMVASRSAIQNAINHYYGQIAGESADSTLQEFTDSAISFCELSDETELYQSVSGLGPPASASINSLDEDSLEDLCYADDSDDAVQFRSLPPQPLRRIRKMKQASASSAPLAAPAVRQVTLFFSEAFQLGASHIILRVQDDGLQVIHFIDGKETLGNLVSKKLLRQILENLKILCHVDPLVTDEYQLGTTKMTVGDRVLHAEIHFAPSLDGDVAMIDMKNDAESVPPTIEQWKQQFVASQR